MGTLVGLAVICAILSAALGVYTRGHPVTVGMRDAPCILPDLLRLLQGLIADKTLPLGVRIKLALLLVYLLAPLDLVPNRLPVIGCADDVIILAVFLRSAVRSSGPEPLRRHWRGSPSRLIIIEKLAAAPSRTVPAPSDARP